MDDHTQNILITISQNPVTNVIAPAGMGKTTILPTLISQNNNRIMVVVSNDTIAKSLNKAFGNDKLVYISQEETKKNMYDIIRKRGCNDLDYTDILMIDEADSGSLDQSIIMLLWRYCAESRAKVPHLLLVSSNPIKLNYFDINYYQIDNYQTRTIEYISVRNNVNEDLIDLIYNTHTSSVEGNILVFTSDPDTADHIFETLHQIELNNAHIITVHSQSENYIDLYENENGNRKIIITDHLAETSLGVKNVKVIIDTMLDRVKDLTLSGGVRYGVGKITKAQADIRASRGGESVLVYRMISQQEYNRIPDTTKPEIYRNPLHYTMLELMDNNINPFEVLDIFPEKSLNHNYDLILRLGIINTNSKVTTMGKTIKNIPLGLRNSVALYRYVQLSNSKNINPYPAIVLLTMIDSFSPSSYFIYPLKNNKTSRPDYNLELLEHRKRYFYPFEGRSDVHTYSNIWNIMMEELGNYSENNIKEWCDNNFINFDIIKEVLDVTIIISDTLRRMNLEVTITTFDTDEIMDILGPILSDIYSDRTMILSNGRYLGSDKNVYKTDTLSINSIDRNKPDKVIGLVTSKISSSYGADFHLISCSLV